MSIGFDKWEMVMRWLVGLWKVLGTASVTLKCVVYSYASSSATKRRSVTSFAQSGQNTRTLIGAKF